MSSPTTHVRQTVIARAQSLCERCSAPGTQVHHRQPRKAGGSRRAHINAPSNLVLLCAGDGGCHEYVERNRSESYEDGWLVREPLMPPAVPVRVAGIGMVYLSDEGGYRPVEVSA